MRLPWSIVALALAACHRAQGTDRLTRQALVATAIATEQPLARVADNAAEALPGEIAKCAPAEGIFLFVTPGVAWVGAPLRVLAVSDSPLEGTLRILPAGKREAAGPDAALVGSSAVRHGGPPYFFVAELESPRAGPYDARFTQQGCEAGAGEVTKRILVGAWKPPPPVPPKEGAALWPVYRTWNRALENVYSAWIEHLFDAPDAEMPSWPALHEVLRDKRRNLLFDHLAAGEDSANAPVVRPDCADLPYFLRAYFAFKLRLPFGLSECNRGGGGAPPSCKPGVLVSNFDVPVPFDDKASAVKAFGTFLRGTVADKAHSGSARQPFEEQNSDYYPVSLTETALRPGVTYADPYGHVLMIAKRVPQSATRGGQLFAVDGQPDGTVARKRYWRGNFLYATRQELGGPGFKRFRPVARRSGKLTRLDDDAIRKNPDYGDVSFEATKLDIEGFYDTIDDVLSPHPLDPERAMLETLDALEEQVRTRIKSLDNGRRWLAATRELAVMPEGPDIFETSGPWEDFSTPSRDLRILIAVDIVRTFPSRVVRRPERFAMPAGQTNQQVREAMDRSLERELRQRRVTYTRTDGSLFTLSLEDVLRRTSALEVAYNPNDCIESRWGAHAGSEELETCRAHAPKDQRARMETYRTWFHERSRPPRK